MTTPWAAIGMSRASWYRHGKPVIKPERMTQVRLARQLETSVRTIQRAARIEREAPTLMPAIASGELSVAKAFQEQCEIYTGFEPCAWRAQNPLIAPVFDAACSQPFRHPRELGERRG